MVILMSLENVAKPRSRGVKGVATYCKKLMALGVALWMHGDMVMDTIQTWKYWKSSSDLNPAHPKHWSQSLDHQYSSLCAELHRAQLLESSHPIMTLKDNWEKICSFRNKSDQHVSHAPLKPMDINSEFKIKLEKDVLCQVRREFQDASENSHAIALCPIDLSRVYFVVSIFTFSLPPMLFLIWFLYAAWRLYGKALKKNCCCWIFAVLSLP